jgi:hypothetical protein
MKIMGSLMLVVGAVGASFPTPAAVAEKPIVLELKLPSKPAYPRPKMADVLTSAPLRLEVQDARGDGDAGVVGVERVKDADGYVWRTAQPVAATVKEHVTQVLNGWSVRVLPEADTSLVLALTAYYVTERSDKFGSTYIANVSFKASLHDRDGAVLWTGEAADTTKDPGVDARASMCNEALSLALRGALAKLMSSVTLGGQAAAVPAAAAAAAPKPVSIEPDALFADLTRLKAGGVGDDVLVAYVEGRKLTRPLSVDEILRFKGAGLPDAAIKAATRP